MIEKATVTQRRIEHAEAAIPILAALSVTACRKEPMAQEVGFQGSLFENDAEVLARGLANEQKRLERKLAWEQGKPFPDDQAKWQAAWRAEHRDEINALCRERYRATYAQVAEYYLRSQAQSRASRLGCKIGRRGPILKVYHRAVHAPIILCYWCKQVTVPGERHVDHKEPLATAGPHVAGNLCITCESCNLSKGDVSPAEFRRSIETKRAANSLLLANYFRNVKQTHPESLKQPQSRQYSGRYAVTAAGPDDL